MNWTSRIPALVLGLGLSGTIGCQDDDQQDIPNRVLDRPTDVALVCANRPDCESGEDGDEACEAEMLGLSACAGETGSCTKSGNHSIGFVANSERNEIAVFTKCSNGLVDLSPGVPGYNFLPAGTLPTELAASENGCRVLSANVGSCDMTLLDAQGLSHYALDLGAAVDEPSSLVSTLVPLRLSEFDGGTGGEWVPLGSRPADIIVAPGALSTAPSFGGTLESNCDPQAAGSLYATFPTCNLIAEIDVQTGYILQSRQFVSDGVGGFDLVDTGVTPTCPVECPAQFAKIEGGVPADLPAVDQDGPFPQAIELLEPPPILEPSADDPGSDQADLAVESRSLFVGGLGSDELVEIRMDDNGQWEQHNTLELTQASGIKRIRVSPPVNIGIGQGAYSQYLYVIAGDGSTRVVGRELPADPDSVGIECETQLDPAVVPPGTPVGCVPVSVVPSEAAPLERRGLARGPGIRPGTGGEVTDWMFRKTYVDAIDDDDEPLNNASPFSVTNTVAVGVTTEAEAIYVVIDHPRVAEGGIPVTTLPGTVDGADETGVMDITLLPHSQWNDPNAQGARGLPILFDEAPLRTSANDVGIASYLSPTLRWVDGAYIEDEDAEDDGYDVGAALGIGEDRDRLSEALYDINADLALEPLYTDLVPKIIARDYRSWFPAQWTIEWEGTILSDRVTGRVACDNPGWMDASCLVSEADDSRLVDESATFCDSGVLAGDKLVIVGCTEDAGCGEGRRCLRETTAGGDSSGICISEQDYDENAAELRQVCANFISDPCGEAYREFTVTRAFQNELWLQGMTTPPMSHARNLGTVEAKVTDAEGNYLDAAGQITANAEDAETVERVRYEEVSGSFVCSDEQPNDGCATDDECVVLLSDDLDENGAISDDERDDRWMCVEDRCRRVCEDDDECLLRRLPGPACFKEFVRYRVDLRNAFRLGGPVNFPNSRVEVIADPEGTDTPNECVPTQDPEISQLLSNRIPVPSGAGADDPDWLAIPECPNTSIVEPSAPNPCRVVATRGQNDLFHTLSYTGDVIEAFDVGGETEWRVHPEAVSVGVIRFSNPVLSFMMDLTSLDNLTSLVPESEIEQRWPAEWAHFDRARIPRGYTESFRMNTAGGYLPFADLLTLLGSPVTMPVRIIPGPSSSVAYVVDGSGTGSSSAVRGQVLRVELSQLVTADSTFDGVR